jgi:hypothetical protein
MTSAASHPIALGVMCVTRDVFTFLILVAALHTTTMSTSSLSSLPESSTRTPPPASAPAKSSPVGKVPPYFIPHKRDQVQAFDETVQQLELLTPEQFLKCLGVRDDLLPSEIPNSARGLSNSNFCLRANVIARSIKARREHRLLCIYLFLRTHDFH